MLDHLRQRIAAALAPARAATLATGGPAGLQADLLPCAASDLLLYLLLPRTSDHLLNLEADSLVVVTAADWQMRGRARVLAADERPTAAALLDAPEAPWSVLVEVRPTRVTLGRHAGWGAAETIDLE